MTSLLNLARLLGTGRQINEKFTQQLVSMLDSSRKMTSAPVTSSLISSPILRLISESVQFSLSHQVTEHFRYTNDTTFVTLTLDIGLELIAFYGRRNLYFRLSSQSDITCEYLCPQFLPSDPHLPSNPLLVLLILAVLFIYFFCCGFPLVSKYFQFHEWLPV